MHESLRDAGADNRFDYFILSDSTKETYCAAEMAAYRALRRRHGDWRIFYRNRADNIGHKSGNIEDFCKNWGAMYEFMVVLDADSLMTSHTLVRLVHAMYANPRAALIQTSPRLIGGKSIFARSQQFASWVYGRIYAAGLARLQGGGGNYWGHNAIIRVRAFMENCGLPALPGREPLGGEILSHDFVEAALLLRAGWEIWLAADMEGSYESSPPTLIDYLKRDRRWCQGNLQHIKLLFAQGLRPSSRIHFGTGIMSYMSSPLWLLLVVLFIINAVELEHTAPATFVGRYPVLAWPISHTAAFVSVAVAAMAILYLPKFIALIVLLRDPGAASDYGGVRTLILGVVIESLLSTLMAPIFMLSHSWFVTNILIGRMTRWGAQFRGGDGIRLGRAAVAFSPHTSVALVTGLSAWCWTPGDFWWYLPMLMGLVVGIPIAWLTSLPGIGEAVRRCGVFVVPSETVGLPIVARVDTLLAEAQLGRRADNKIAFTGEALPTRAALSLRRAG